MKRKIAASIALALVTTACQQAQQTALPMLRQAGEDLGVITVEQRMIIVDILRDDSEYSPGENPETFWSTLSTASPPVIATNGEIRQWTLTADGVRLAATFRVTPLTKPGTPARRAHEAAEIARARAVFGPHISAARAPGQQSRLFAAITRIANETTPSTATRYLILISDLRNYDPHTTDATHADWECGMITPLDRLVPLLDRERYLTPGSMKNIRVHVVAFAPSVIPRCAGHEQARYAELQTRWTALLTRAGASVSFSTGPLLDLKGDNQ